MTKRRRISWQMLMEMTELLKEANTQFWVKRNSSRDGVTVCIFPEDKEFIIERFKTLGPAYDYLNKLWQNTQEGKLANKAKTEDDNLE